MRSSDPRADNLLCRLFSYTPREGREPLEDFCTEALAWCLLNSTDFRKRFFTLIGKPEWNSEIEIHTQWNYRNNDEDEEDEEGKPTSRKGKNSDPGRFDLFILSKKDESFAIVLESKVKSDSSLDDQLIKYRHWLDLHFKGRKSLIVTLTSYKCDPEHSDINIRWSSVEEELRQSTLSESQKSIFLNFADFLKEKGLGKMKLTPLTLDDPTRFENAFNFLNEYQKILQSLRQDGLFESKSQHAILEWNVSGGFFGLYFTGWKGWAGIGYYLNKREVLLWVEFYLKEDQRAKADSFSEDLKILYQQTVDYFKKGADQLCGTGAYLDENGGTVFTFIQPVKAEFNGNAEKTREWFKEILEKAGRDGLIETKPEN